MLTIGTCRICEAGPLGLRKCGVCRRVVVLCDECDAAWPTAETAGKPTYATQDDMPCPCCAASLLSGGSRWATNDEAIACGICSIERLTEAESGEPTRDS